MLKNNSWGQTAKQLSILRSLQLLDNMNTLSVCEYLIHSDPHMKERIHALLKEPFVTNLITEILRDKINKIPVDGRRSQLQLYTLYAYHKAPLFQISSDTLDLLVTGEAYLPLVLTFTSHFPKN